MDFTPTGEWHTSHHLQNSFYFDAQLHPRFPYSPSSSSSPSFHPFIAYLPCPFSFFLFSCHLPSFSFLPPLTSIPSFSFCHLPPSPPPVSSPLFFSSLPPSLSFIPLVTIGEYRRPWMSIARRPKLHCMALNKQGILKTPSPSLENELQ